MKKLIFLILILFACTKGKEYCFKCNVLSITTTNGGGYATRTDRSIVTIDKCGITQKAIDEFESLESGTTNVKSGGYTIVTNTTCTCIRQ